MDQKKMGVLAGLSPVVADLVAKHKRDDLWYPDDYLKPFFEKVRERSNEVLAQIAAIPGGLRAALVLNLCTEEGLPHFHRLIAHYLGNKGPWGTWNNLWTAEESRHGDGINAYITMTNLVDRGALERMLFLYIRAGFNPNWGEDPYKLLGYTVLQEHATQISHGNLSAKVAGIEPVLGELLQKIAGDEARHATFYREVFRRVLDADVDEALASLYDVMRHFSMPGSSAPDFSVLQEIQERSNLFTALDYKKIVSAAIKLFRLEKLSPITDEGKRTLEKILRLPIVLERVVVALAEAKKTPKTFTLAFLPHPITV